MKKKSCLFSHFPLPKIDNKFIYINEKLKKIKNK